MMSLTLGQAGMISMHALCGAADKVVLLDIKDERLVDEILKDIVDEEVLEDPGFLST